MSPLAQLPVVVAIGSNVGDRVAHVRRAFTALQVRFPGVHRPSSLHRTAPVDCPDGSGDFVNAVVVIEQFDATPSCSELLSGLLTLERTFGRTERRVRNEPRVLDLDVIAAGALCGDFGSLTLPHPRAAQRAFVLAPLAELLPDFVLPHQTRTVRELLAELGPLDIERLAPA